VQARVVRIYTFVLPAVSCMTKTAFPLLSVLITLTWTSPALAHDLWIERGDGGFLLRYGHHRGAVLPLGKAFRIHVRPSACRGR
jgi:hypothetical protein